MNKPSHVGNDFSCATNTASACRPEEPVQHLERETLPFQRTVQLHEFEAYLFSDLTGLKLIYEDTHKIAQLQSLSYEYASPELINDGAETAPFKRIIRLFPDYEAAKTTVGAQAAQLIGLAIIRARCPHFDR